MEQRSHAARGAARWDGAGLGRALLCSLAMLGLMAAPATAQKRGGILSTITLEDPVGFDQHSPKKVSSYTQRALSFTHSRLFQYPRDGRGVEGDLVESWSQPTPTTYVLKLHQGVRFHAKPPVNGRELTAEDVKWTYDRMMKQSPEKRLFPTLKNTMAVDPYTVRFELKAPFGPFIANLAATTMTIYAQEAGKPCDSCAGGRDFTSAETVIGTGPFMLESYREGQMMIFKRHPDYFRKGLPYLDGANVYIIKDAAAQIAAFRTNKVQLLEDVVRVDYNSAQEAKLEPGTVVQPFPFYNTGENLIGRVDKKPWNDIRVRRAISLAIDRDAWGRGLFPQGYTRYAGPIPETSEFYVPEEKLGDVAKWYRYDPAEAKRLLAEAGYGSGTKIKLYATVGYGPAYATRTALIKDLLSKVGIEAEIVAQEYPQWIKHTYAGNFPEMALVHIPRWGLGDDDEWLGSYLPGNTRNQTHLNDARINELVARSRNGPSYEDRRRAIEEFQRHFHEQMYRVFLPKEMSLIVIKDNIKGYTPKIKGYDFPKHFERVWIE
ncbi:MAG: ABC transporter substrate-binding protein [Candidatus Lambdaproteobacteria bacterium]|nr:ABC transporter substrate-binding protein [Candidatus Lambdaproteobacteria bacterium]